jgi:hypothetical protein
MTLLEAIFGLTVLNTGLQVYACYQRHASLQEQKRANGNGQGGGS